MAQWCSPTKQGEAERTSGVKHQQHIVKESCIWYSVYDTKNSESVDELLDESLNNHNDSPVDPIASLKNNPLRWTRQTTTNFEDSFVKKRGRFELLTLSLLSLQLESVIKHNPVSAKE